MNAPAASGPRTDANDDASLGFVVELERFRGPLDLLLHLIREQDIDIFDIPIAQITEQFLKALEGIDRLGIDRAGEFIEMAATLIRIKAQMLLPRHVDESGEWEDPRAELVRRLLEYEHFREAADRLEDSEADRRREVMWDEVWQAALGLGDRHRPLREHRVPQRSIPLEDKITLILDALTKLARVEFRRLISPFADRLHTVVTLLGALELARRRDLAIRQGEPFGPIWLFRTNGEAAGPRGADRNDPDTTDASMDSTVQDGKDANEGDADR